MIKLMMFSTVFSAMLLVGCGKSEKPLPSDSDPKSKAVPSMVPPDPSGPSKAPVH